jgi:apolipoprotein N-acyltransferase
LRIAGLVLEASICYEDGYASSRLPALEQATALVNVTNDAWFGRSPARYQHLQISRMRAQEARRFMIRAANDGVSAVIGPRGELVATAPEYRAAVLRAAVEPRSAYRQSAAHRIRAGIAHRRAMARPATRCGGGRGPSASVNFSLCGMV